MNLARTSSGEAHVTAPECAAAGLAPVEFCLRAGEFAVTSRLRGGAYLEVTGPTGSSAWFGAWPTLACDGASLAQALTERVSSHGHAQLGPEGEVVVAGEGRLAVSAHTGQGDGRVEHVGVLLVDPMHAPRGMLLVFSVATPEVGHGMPTPESLLARPVFAPLLAALRLGPPRRDAPRVSHAFVAPPRPAEIEYVDGVERVRRRLGVRETFGRARDNSVVLTDTMTSKHHAVIEWDGSHYVLIDRGSINGTRVDGHLVRGVTTLSHNAKIELGRVSMRFRELVSPVSSQLQELMRCFEHEGIAVPYVPPALGVRLQSPGPWFFTTEPLPAPPLHGDLGVAVTGDFLVVFHGPATHGVSTIQYCLGLGPLRVALEWPWTLGAAGPQATSARHLIAASVLGLRALVGATLQCVRHARWPRGVVLEVRAVHGAKSSWSPVGGGLARRTTGALGLPAPDVLAEALAWVHGL